MGARVESSYSRGVRISEENLIRVDDIIRKRTDNLDPKPDLAYRVFRLDDFYVDYKLPAEVIAEENSQRNLVTALEISASCKGLSAKIAFSKDDGCKLAIEADDRDLAFLLTSDLKEYMNTEIFKKGIDVGEIVGSEKVFAIISLLALSIMMVGAMYSVYSVNIKSAPYHLIHSHDLNEKLNFIISQRSNDAAQPKAALLFSPMLVLLALTGLRYGRNRYQEEYFIGGGK